MEANSTVSDKWEDSGPPPSLDSKWEDSGPPPSLDTAPKQSKAINPDAYTLTPGEAATFAGDAIGVGATVASGMAEFMGTSFAGLAGLDRLAKSLIGGKSLDAALADATETVEVANPVVGLKGIAGGVGALAGGATLDEALFTADKILSDPQLQHPEMVSTEGGRKALELIDKSLHAVFKEPGIYLAKKVDNPNGKAVIATLTEAMALALPLKLKYMAREGGSLSNLYRDSIRTGKEIVEIVQDKASGKKDLTEIEMTELKERIEKEVKVQEDLFLEEPTVENEAFASGLIPREDVAEIVLRASKDSKTQLLDNSIRVEGLPVKSSTLKLEAIKKKPEAEAEAKPKKKEKKKRQVKKGGFHDYGVLELTKSERESLEYVKEGVASGRQAEHFFNYEVDKQGGTPDVIGGKSSYPSWYQNAGHNSAKVLETIDKALNGEMLTQTQRVTLEGLNIGARGELADILRVERRTINKSVMELKEGDTFEVEGEIHAVKLVNEEAFLPKVEVVSESGKVKVWDGEETIKYDRGTYINRKGEVEFSDIEIAKKGTVDPNAELEGQTGMFSGGREMPKGAKIAGDLEAQLEGSSLFDGAARARAAKQEDMFAFRGEQAEKLAGEFGGVSEVMTIGSGVGKSLKATYDWIGKLDQGEVRAVAQVNDIQASLVSAIGLPPSRVFRIGVPFMKRAAYNRHLKKMDRAMQVYIDLRNKKSDPGRFAEQTEKYWHRLSKEQQELIRLAQVIDNSPKLKEVADRIVAIDRESGVEAKAHGVINDLVEDHLSRRWKKRGEGSFFGGKRKFETSRGAAKQRTYESILEGFAKGRELEIEGATSVLYETLVGNDAVIQNRRFIEMAKKIKTEDGTPLMTTSHLDGYKAIEHPGMRGWKYAGKIKALPLIERIKEISHTREEINKFSKDGAGAPDSKPLQKLKEIVMESLKARGFSEGEASNFIARIGSGKAEADVLIKEIKETIVVKEMQEVTGFSIEEMLSQDIVIAKDGTILKKTQLYAPEEMADSLNRVLGKSGLEGPIWDNVTKYNAVIKAWILQSNLFHYLAFMRSYLLGVSGKKGKEWNISHAMQEGLRAAKEQDPMLMHGVRNGLTLGKMQDWNESIIRREKTIIGNTLDKMQNVPGGKIAKNIADEISQLREDQANYLFNHVGAGLKAQSYMIEFRNQVKSHPTEKLDVLAERAAELINADFGGWNLRRTYAKDKYRNATTQHVARLILLSPDWTESYVRTFAHALGGGTKARRQFYRKFWAGIITRGMQAHIAMNVMMATLDDKTFVERMELAWENRGLRGVFGVDITPIARSLGGTEGEDRTYWDIFGHFYDPVRWVTDPVEIGKHKSSVVSKWFFEVLTGTDWKGHKFTTYDEFLGTDKEGEVYTSSSLEHGIGDPKGGQYKGQLTKAVRGHSGLEYSQYPSFVATQVRGSQPAQAQQLMSKLAVGMQG